MINGILGKKIGMTSVFEENGNIIPVTVLEAGPCKIVQIKTDKKDGYSVAQIGYMVQNKKNKFKKPLEGHFKKAKTGYMKILREFSVQDTKNIKVGDTVDVDLFKDCGKVSVSGVSKGKGFAGVMKRWNFKGHPASRGNHESFRGPGSIGQCADPGRVFKGKKMPGHMGAENITVKNVNVVKIIKDKNIILLKGAVPGANGSIVEIKVN